jgi:hypothetical protein
LTICLLCLFAVPASAEEATVGTSGEAWYATLPTCTAAAACAPTGVVPPTSPFPEGTLHVARALGTELARSYIQLDLTSLPLDAVPTGGTLTLPLSVDQTAGTLRPEEAHIEACFMVVSFTPGIFGSIEEPPSPDCFTSASAQLVTLEAGSAFVVDLAPFAERWAAGEPNEGIALVPALEDAPEGPLPPGVLPVPVPSDETWHVAFNGSGAAEEPRISAAISYTLPAVELPPQPALPPVTVPAIPGYHIPAQQPAATAPPAFVPQQPQTILVATHGFQYAGVFVLPLIALAVGSAVSYSLTRDIETKPSS